MKRMIQKPGEEEEKKVADTEGETAAEEQADATEREEEEEAEDTEEEADTSHRRLTARLNWASSCVVAAGTVNYSTLPPSHPDPHPPLPFFFVTGVFLAVLKL